MWVIWTILKNFISLLENLFKIIVLSSKSSIFRNCFYTFYWLFYDGLVILLFYKFKIIFFFVGDWNVPWKSTFADDSPLPADVEICAGLIFFIVLAWHNSRTVPGKNEIIKIIFTKVVMQGKLFQRCTHLLYCSVLSLGGNLNTRRMSKPGMGSIFHIKNLWNLLVIGKYYVNYQNYQNLMLLTPSDTKRTMMHLLLFTNSAQKEQVSISTLKIPDRN